MDPGRPPAGPGPRWADGDGWPALGTLRAGKWWDRAFLAGIILKGLDGLAELVGGLLLLLTADPERIHRCVIRLTPLAVLGAVPLLAPPWAGRYAPWPRPVR